MFAGIVQTTGIISEVAPCNDGDASQHGNVRMVIEIAALREEPQLGASIAINGTCLTVVAVDLPNVSFDVVPETLRLTNLGLLSAGDRVNIEQSLRFGDRVDGHFVQGHIEGVGHVEAIERERGEYKMWFVPPPALLKYLVPKGSIALDGVSLTIANVQDGCGAVALIPTTLSETNLGDRVVGDALNIETDIMTRTIVDRVESVLQAKGLDDPERLRAAVREITK